MITSIRSDKIISIHSPRMGRDGYTPALDFNPLSPHGERRDEVARKMTENLISIHSPRMGRDASCCSRRRTSCYFNPLSPHGERLVRDIWHRDPPFISIHSPRMGRD